MMSEVAQRPGLLLSHKEKSLTGLANHVGHDFHAVETVPQIRFHLKSDLDASLSSMALAESTQCLNRVRGDILGGCK